MTSQEPPNLPGAASGQTYPQQGQWVPSGRTNGLAIAALVCGLAGFVTWISAPVGIGLGIAALVQIKRRGDSGKGMAIAGIVSGALVTIGILLLIAMYLGLFY